MKIFKLKSVAYRNLLAVGSTLITVDLQSHHKSLVTGVNGGGKSTIIEAITYALFGKPFRNIKLGQLINSVNKKDLWVELIMEYGNNEYTIRRGQKPTVFEVLRNGVHLDAAASSKDFQAEFELMIGMNYTSYKQVVVLGTAGYTPFMSLKTPERRKLVEDLLEVSVLATMDKANKDQVKEINNSIKEVDLKISHNRAQLGALVAADERQKKLSGDNVARLETMLTDAIDSITKIKETNAELSEKLLAIELPADVTTEAAEVQSKAVAVDQSRNSITRVLGLYERGGDCPTCLQQLTASDKTAEMEQNRAKLNAEFDELTKLREELAAKRKAFAEVQHSMTLIENEMATNRSLAQQHAQRGQQVKAALAEAKKDFVDNSKEIERLQTEHADLVTAKSDLAVERHQRSLITEMLKDSGIKGGIIKKYVPMFNRQINYYLGLLGADYSFTLDEEFNETIKSRGRESFSYASFSQGEKGRIDLALMFTWRDVAEKISGIKITCLILDEVFDGAFDASATKSVTTILNTMQDTNVFIISHRDHNPEDYGQHIQMKKVGRFTVAETT